MSVLPARCVTFIIPNSASHSSAQCYEQKGVQCESPHAREKTHACEAHFILPLLFCRGFFFFFSLLSIILLLPLSVMCYECMFNVYALTASCSILLFFSFLFLTVVSLDEVAVLYAVEALTLQLPSICWLRIRCWCCCSLFFFPRSFSVPSLFSYVSVLHSYGAWYVHIIIYGAKKIGRSL